MSDINQAVVRYHDELQDGGEGEEVEFEDFRSFTEFLDRRAVVWGSTPFERDRIRFANVWVLLDQATILDDLTGFAEWLDDRVRGSASNTATTPAFCFPTKQLSIDTSFLIDCDEKIAELMSVLGPPQGSAILGNLLTLIPVSEVELCQSFSGSEFYDASRADRILARGTTQMRNATVVTHSPVCPFDASTAQALGRVVPHLCLDDLTLIQSSAGDEDRENVPVILRAVLNGELSPTKKLHLWSFKLTTIDSECWDLLSGNRHLTELTLPWCTLSFNALEGIWSALKRNVALRRLGLTESYVDDDSGALGEELGVSTSARGNSMPVLLQALRRNRTLELLELPYEVLRSQGLRLLIVTMRYHNHNNTLRVILPHSYVLAQALLDAAHNFHQAFHTAFQVVPEQGGAAATGRDGDGAVVFRQWWPLLGSSHPTGKATVFFCVARVRG